MWRSFIGTRRYSPSWAQVSSSLLDLWWENDESDQDWLSMSDHLNLAQCSLPLTSWVRKQPTGGDYLCHTCHIQKNGLREGLIAVMWKKQMKSSLPSDRTTYDSSYIQIVRSKVFSFLFRRSNFHDDMLLIWNKLEERLVGGVFTFKALRSHFPCTSSEQWEILKTTGWRKGRSNCMWD